MTMRYINLLPIDIDKLLYRLTSQSPADYQNLLLYTEYFSVIGRLSVCSALISRELTLPDEVSSIWYMRSETEFL